MAAHPFVDSYLEAWNRNDADAVGEHLAPHSVYRDIPVEQTMERAALIETLRTFFADAPHRYELVGDVVCASDTVAFQYRMVPSAKDARDHGLRVIRGAEFIQLEGGKAISISDYYQLDEPASAPDGDLANPGVASGGRKYAKSGLDKDRIAYYQRRLTLLMNEESYYLRPDLTLPRLARDLDCSVNHLSQVINAGFGMSFFDWISQYRIDHAKVLLREDEPQPVLSIAYAVGFNSNSAFYAAFKKWVGTTPTSYRDRNEPED